MSQPWNDMQEIIRLKKIEKECIGLRTEKDALHEAYTIQLAENARLRSLATRWYLPDGTYETLPEEEVIRRRKEAAKRAGDVEGIKWAIFKAFEHGSPSDAARALVAYLNPVTPAGGR